MKNVEFFERVEHVVDDRGKKKDVKTIRCRTTWTDGQENSRPHISMSERIATDEDIKNHPVEWKAYVESQVPEDLSVDPERLGAEIGLVRPTGFGDPDVFKDGEE